MVNKSVSIAIAAFVAVMLIFSSCIDDGKYIVSYKEVAPIAPMKPSKVKLYIENSGSMDGYMFDGAELKDAVYSYVSGLSTHSDTTELYFVNSGTCQINAPLQNVIYSLSPATMHQAPGNRANTDIAAIFGMVLSQIEPNSISILVTDGILDLPVGATAFFHTKQTQIKTLFENYLSANSNLGVEIYRMSSRFNGKYYYTGGNVTLTDQQRPYYMFVLGDKRTLSVANAIMSKGQIQHGVENYYAYSSYTQVPFLLTDKNKKSNKGHFDVRLQKRELPVIAKVDLSCTLHDEAVLRDTNAYVVGLGDEKIKIKSIKDLPKEPEYSHAISINLPKNADEGDICMYFRPLPYPSWLEGANADISDATVATSMRTTGIKYIIEGISDAFASTCANNPAQFSSEGRVYECQLNNKPVPIQAGWKFRLDKKEHYKSHK